MAGKGWIKLHRKIRDNPIFNDHQLLRLWMICLTEATHKERDQIIGKQTVKLMPGEFVTGRYDITDLYNSGLKNKDKVKGEKTVFRWLETLESGGFLTIKKTNKFSIISIDKWDFYQGNDSDDDQENDHQMTIKRPSNDHQMTTNNNVKNLENEKNDKKKDIMPKLSFSESVKLTQAEYDRLVSEFGEDVTKRAIDYLTSYKAEKGYKTKSDNLTIRRWVIEAVTKQKGDRAFGKHEGHNDRPTSQSKFASADKNKPFDPSELEKLGIT